jgi:putative colanic acid biosynthesis UDP-glucose lipid carrier transferase
MDTLTQEKATDIELQVMQQPLPALYVPIPYEKDRIANYLIFKRVFDVVAASVLLMAVFSWLYPLLYVLIRLTSKGGALFIQKRVGLNGKVFNCLKFRTMVINSEADFIEAGLNDTRITMIGKWLRNTYIDELPQ